MHNILPDEIAARLKAKTSMIADSFASASVLFADVVDFTPMSAGMSAADLVALLNGIFTSFDAFVDELALENQDHRRRIHGRVRCARPEEGPRLPPTWR